MHLSFSGHPLQKATKTTETQSVYSSMDNCVVDHIRQAYRSSSTLRNKQQINIQIQILLQTKTIQSKQLKKYQRFSSISKGQDVRMLVLKIEKKCSS